MTPLSDSEAATVQRFENTEPAPESWGGGLREALAEALVTAAWNQWAGDRDLDAVDHLLALPELAALRAKADAADRVRACIDGMDPIEVALGGLMYVHSEVRAALDGPPC